MENLELYGKVISSIYAGDKNQIDKIYNDFSKLTPRISCYGDTKEACVRNYCRFKDVEVLRLYSGKIR